MTAFFKGNVPLLQLLAEMIFQGSAVRKESIVVLDLCQDCRAYAAFAAAENDCSFHVYLIFKVTMVTTARMMDTIQNLTTILFSGWICAGFWISASGFSFW